MDVKIRLLGLDGNKLRLGIDIAPRVDNGFADKVVDDVIDWLRGSGLLKRAIIRLLEKNVERIKRELMRGMITRARWVDSSYSVLEVDLSRGEALNFVVKDIESAALERAMLIVFSEITNKLEKLLLDIAEDGSRGQS